ncbi:MAG: hypothetical protein GYB50_20630 [Rhodobacteraceae bacterium]|nr:hypothetical protein [Paracoccaceae bacterium]
MSNPRIALKMAAFAHCMALKANTVERGDLEALRGHVQRYAYYPDELSREIEAFCVALAEAVGRTREIELADRMISQLAIMNMPAPPDQDRRDIHG